MSAGSVKSLSQRSSTHVRANCLQLRRCSRQDVHGRRTPHTKQALQRLADILHVRSSHAETRGRQADLLNEVAHLVGVESHELVHFVHGGDAAVRGEALGADGGAAQQVAEEFVEVGEEAAGHG